jgi:anhydro-N-acetylmuramic acid kinase
VLWIGLLSGTSADAVDAALVRIGDSIRDLTLVAFCSIPLPGSLRKHIHEIPQAPVPIRNLAQLDVAIAERLAEAALEVAREAGVRPEDIEGIGSHGQTVGHFPEPEVRASLQLGAPAVIYERTRIPVIADFRSADLAAGGQGAPLTPFFHHACLAEASECRAILNIGGFTNLSYLPDLDPGHVIAFDAGPGNALIDRAARWASGGSERFDRNGSRARLGRADPTTVQELLGDAYFSRRPPKSTGHEYFDQKFFERARERVLSQGGGPNDVVATLTELTVESIRDQAGRFFPTQPSRWIVYGGGVWNTALLDGLRARVAPASLELSDDHGIPADAFEAVTFAVLGWCAARGTPSNLPSATGARRAVVLGTATPPSRSAEPRKTEL